MKIAFVYDRVNKWGGAERVLLALHRIWPEAPLFTAVYDAKKAPWAQVFDVRTSFLQKVPFAKNHHELLAWITPFAFETFSFDDFDVVISITSAEAKTIITKPETLHICYCLTSTRYLWSGFAQYITNPILGNILRLFAPMLKRWDLVGASRPDYFIAISQRVKKRIETYYNREVSEVIYPPVKILKNSRLLQQNYFLTVSRLVGYKRIDVIIDAFNALGYPLVVIGNGMDKKILLGKAKKNITFVDHYLTDSELVRYYEQCRAFVFAADEDFGIAAVEAQMCGKPVIAYRHSGLAETVLANKTGVLYDWQSAPSLVEAIKTFEKISFNPDIIRSHAQQFNEDIFATHIKQFVQRKLKA